MSGAIDFGKADRFDPWWWRKLNWVTEEIERRQAIPLLMTYLEQFSSAFSLDNGADTCRRQLAIIEARRDQLKSMLMPWLEEKEEQDLQVTAKDLRGEYAGAFGDPSDPAVAEEISKLLAHWESTR